MSRSFGGRFWVILVVFGGILGTFFISMRKVLAATISLEDVPVGKVFSVNGMKFAKTSNDGKLMAICESNSCGSIEHCTSCSTAAVNVCTKCEAGYGLSNEGKCVELLGTLQNWDDCEAYATPEAAGYTAIGYLTDERDGMAYEIRKFADGKCWMADNLAYGGGIDNCEGVSIVDYVSGAAYGGGLGMVNPSDRFGEGTYGNCHDLRVDAAVGPCKNSSVCGYSYNWQAAMQLSSAYQGSNVVYPDGAPSLANHLQGICPVGWHVPSGGTVTANSEFATLDVANGGTGVNRSGTDAACNFWRPGGAFKGVYAGFSMVDGGGTYLSAGGVIFVWSTQQQNTHLGYDLYVSTSQAFPGDDPSNKFDGASVRCVKD